MNAERAEQIEKRIAKLYEAIAELQEGISAIEYEITQLEKKVEEAKRKEKEWPSEGDTVFRIGGDGTVGECHFNRNAGWNGGLSIGNVFRTQEEAEFALERLKVLEEMRRMAVGKLNDMAISIVYSKDERCLKADCSCVTGLPAFADFKRLNECIEKIGEERMKKYIFMVND